VLVARPGGVRRAGSESADGRLHALRDHFGARYG